MQEVDLNQAPSDRPRHHRHASKSDDQTAGTFDLPYRMIYAVATHDTVYVYDTQQSSPICLFSNLHFSSFTDLSWLVHVAPLFQCTLYRLTLTSRLSLDLVGDVGEKKRTSDGETLVLSSSDGYCSLVIFEKHELGERMTEEEMREHLPPTLMMRHVMGKEQASFPSSGYPGKPAASSSSSSSAVPHSGGGVAEQSVGALPEPRKREMEQQDGDPAPGAQPASAADALPQKKKKRVALTYEGPVNG
jgi:chromatin assembly factor 1 subunit B